VDPIRFWIPANLELREVIIPGDFIESIIMPALNHEAGHIIAAHHLGATILGIAIADNKSRNNDGLTLQAIYETEGWSIESHCIVKAAGPAADLLYRGQIDEKGASGDLSDIKGLTGIASLTPFLEEATEILAEYAAAISCIAIQLEQSLTAGGLRYARLLPGGHLGLMLVEPDRLLRCLRRGGLSAALGSRCYMPT
jgi:hypothetical protein